MKSITVHAIDDRLYQRIKGHSERLGLSLNKTIKTILSEKLGVSRNLPDHRDEFMDLFGTWTREEYEEFQRNVEDFERIDEEDWR